MEKRRGIPAASDMPLARVPRSGRGGVKSLARRDVTDDVRASKIPRGTTEAVLVFEDGSTEAVR